MVRRYVNFAIASDGAVTPSLPQYGGVKGEHNATILQFTLDSTFIGEGDVIRLRFTGGDGAVLSSDLIEETTTTDEGITFSYPLPRLLTIPAGQLCVRVAVTSLNENGDEVQGYCSNEAVIWFDEAEVENGTPFWTGVSEMLRRTVTAKESAVAAQTATQAAFAETKVAAISASSSNSQAQAARDAAKGYADTASQSATAARTAAVTAEQAAGKANVSETRAAACAAQAANDAAVSATAAKEAKEALDSVESPHIGNNGNWYVGETDTGVRAKGDKGDDGIVFAVETLFDSDINSFETGVVTTAGDISTTSGGGADKFYIPAVPLDRGTVTVRITAFADNGSTAANQNLWIAQYDADGAFIEGSRELFALHPIREDGTVDTTVSSSSLLDIQNQTNGFVCGGRNTITPKDGAVSAILFNFNKGVNVDVEVFTGDDTVYQNLVKETKEIAAKVEVINSQDYREGGIAACADYVESLCCAVSAAAKAHMTKNSACLVLFTDTHYKNGDSMVATRVAKYLATLTNPIAILHLGDLADWVNEDKAAATALWEKHNAMLSDCKVPCLQVVGNHDDGNLYNRLSGDRAATNYAASWELFHATTAGSRRDIVLGSKNGWYYLDDEDSKTRIIVLNSHDYPWQTDENGDLVYDSSVRSDVENGIKGIYSPEQIDWLANAALAFPAEGWTAVVCAHKGTANFAVVNYLLANAKNGNRITGIPQTGVFDDIYGLHDYSGVTITTDYSVCHPDKVLFLRGDDHEDKINTDNKYPIVTFLNASLAKSQTSAPVKTAGTPTETAVSVLVLDNEAGVMHEIRFGAGPVEPLTDYDNYRTVDYH